MFTLLDVVTAEGTSELQFDFLCLLASGVAIKKSSAIPAPVPLNRNGFIPLGKCLGSSLYSRFLTFQSGITWCGSFQIHGEFFWYYFFASSFTVVFFILFLEFLLGECWPSWTNPLIFLLFLPYCKALSLCSAFWKIFPFYLPNSLF